MSNIEAIYLDPPLLLFQVNFMFMFGISTTLNFVYTSLNLSISRSSLLIPPLFYSQEVIKLKSLARIHLYSW